MVRTMVRVPEAPVFAADPPTMDQLIDALNGVGCGPEQVQILLGLLTTLTGSWNADGISFVQMNMRAHELLDAVMVDRTAAAPGSVHEMLNQHFLPEGFVFLHDRRGFCTIEIAAAG